MAHLYILQTGQTEWSDSGRMDSAAGVPLSEAGAASVHQLAEDLVDRSIKAVYACKMEADWQTAVIVSTHLGVKAHARDELRGLDYGLWQGLLVEEARQRYGKAFRQFRESPASARPPGGEALVDAQKRIVDSVKKILKKHKDQAVLLVLQPVVAGLLRCRLSGQPIDELWSHVNPLGTYDAHELDQVDLMEKV